MKNITITWAVFTIIWAIATIITKSPVWLAVSIGSLYGYCCCSMAKWLEERDQDKLH